MRLLVYISTLIILASPYSFGQNSPGDGINRLVDVLANEGAFSSRESEVVVRRIMLDRQIASKLTAISWQDAKKEMAKKTATGLTLIGLGLGERLGSQGSVELSSLKSEINARGARHHRRDLLRRYWASTNGITAEVLRTLLRALPKPHDKRFDVKGCSIFVQVVAPTNQDAIIRVNYPYSGGDASVAQDLTIELATELLALPVTTLRPAKGVSTVARRTSQGQVGLAKFELDGKKIEVAFTVPPARYESLREVGTFVFAGFGHGKEKGRDKWTVQRAPTQDSRGGFVGARKRRVFVGDGEEAIDVIVVPGKPKDSRSPPAEFAVSATINSSNEVYLSWSGPPASDFIAKYHVFVRTSRTARHEK